MRIRAKLKIIILLAGILAAVMMPSRLRADQADILYREGLELEDNGKRDFAIFKYSTIVRDYPGSKCADAALFKVAEFYYDNKDYFNAKESFRKLIERYPKSGYAESCRQALENIANMSKKYDLDSAMKKIFSNIEAFRKEQRWDEMFAECEKFSAFEHLPEDYQAKLVEYYKACGDAFVKSELWDSAKAAYEKIMKITPGDVEALNKLYEINKLLSAPTK